MCACENVLHTLCVVNVHLFVKKKNPPKKKLLCIVKLATERCNITLNTIATQPHCSNPLQQHITAMQEHTATIYCNTPRSSSSRACRPSANTL